MMHQSRFSQCFFWLAVFAVVYIQFLLCYEALICRGWPPLTVAGIYKKWSVPFLVALPAVFGSRANRLRGLAVMSLSVTCLFEMISINEMVRPSIGHLAGVTGILRLHGVGISVATVLNAPLAFVLLYFVERVLGDLWRGVWFLSSPNERFEDVWRSACMLFPKMSEENSDAK